MQDLLLGMIILCNGTLYQTQSLNQEVDGLFRISCQVRESNGIQLITPVLTNITDKPIFFRRAFVCATLPPGPYESYVQYNRWSYENKGNWQPLEGRGLMLSHVWGRTTEGNTPFIAFRMIGRSEGVAFHVLPVGDWRIMVQPAYNSVTEPSIEVSLGISDESLDYELAPGESWTLPQVIAQPFTDFTTSTGELHRFLMDNLELPNRLPPVEYNTWIDRYDQLDVPHMREELAAAKEVGCEVFVIDAGWFGAEGLGWWECVGDWHESTNSAFYGKMKDFADEVRAAGLGFGLWIEPERFVPNVPVLKEHPDWFTPYRRMRLEIPEAYEFQKQTFLRLIDTYGIVYMKTDMNGSLGQDDLHRHHNTYVSLFYKLIDEIHQLRPQVFIECCASGAMRTDLEVLKHFDIAFPTDNVHPFEVNDTIAGFWHRYLPGRVMRWATPHQINYPIPFYGKDVKPVITPLGGTWDEFENVDLESLLCSNFTGGMCGFTGSLSSLDEGNRQLVARYIALFKEKREFLWKACGYCPVYQPDFKVMELVNDGNAILHVQYLASDQVSQRRVRPLGLDENAMYTFNDETRSGKDIMRDGILLPLKHKGHILRRRSELFFLDKVK